MNFNNIPISSTAERELRKLKQKIRSTQQQNNHINLEHQSGYSLIEFRIPNADHKHPSSIHVNIHAQSSKEVFQPDKYSTIRFASLGHRAPSKEKLQRLYSGKDDAESYYHNNIIPDRLDEFDSIVQDTTEKYSGITVYTDNGDAAFSGDHYRPHVRIRKANVTGEQLGNYIRQLSKNLEPFYNNLPRTRLYFS